MPVSTEREYACIDMYTQWTDLQAQLAQVLDLHLYTVDPYILEIRTNTTSGSGAGSSLGLQPSL